jgi:hypothetical protein
MEKNAGAWGLRRVRLEAVHPVRSIKKIYYSEDENLELVGLCESPELGCKRY